jgi:hypothetical protein
MVFVALVAACAFPGRAAANPVPTVTLDRDGPVTVLVQSKSAFNVLGIAVTSPAIVPVCADCRGGETIGLGERARGTEIVVRLQDGQKTFLSTDPLHARIDQNGGTWRIGFDDANGDMDFEDLVVTVIVPAPPPPVDEDRDGVSPPTDCIDTNSAVHPGAPEIAGNGLDDDCAGGDALARIAAVVTVTWHGRRKGGVVLGKFQVRDAPPGARIEVRCRGKHCPFKRKRRVAQLNGSKQLRSLIPHRRLKRGVTVDVVITAPNMIGKVRRYKVSKRKMTQERTLCLPPGAKHSVKC